jgi:hypothetical protein
VGTEGFGAAGDRPEIVGIGDAVEGDQQGRLTDAATAIECGR